jgi:magnesium transporter
MITTYYKSIRDPSFKKIPEYRPGAWIHVEEASVEDLDKIMELTDIDFVDLKDSLDKYEIPRIEHDNDNILIFTRHPIELESGLYTMSLTILLTPNYIVTISPQKSPVVNRILNSNLRVGTTQKSKLLFYILLRITQEFNNDIKKVRYTVTEKEKQIEGVSSDDIVLLTKNEEILNQYLTSLVPMRNLLEAISTGRFVSLYEKDIDTLEDLMIAIKQSEDLCNVNIKSIRSLRDAYQIIFTNDVNKTIKRLTAITIIFTVPTIISSIYGMNVSLPLEKNPYAFLTIINIIILLSFILFILFIKKKWL